MIRWYLAISVAVLVLAGTTPPARARGPAQVILIRHGEKPAEGHGLNQKGKERAAALVPYFLGRPEVLQYKTPVAIYAQKSTPEHRSTRPVDTVKALAKALKLDVIEYAHNDFKAMVKEISSKREYQGKMVLICWRHQAIHDIAREFGVKDAPKFPEAFDRTWIISFGKDGKPTLRDLPQKLMFGDSTK
jgi:hypothetical protein